MKFIITKLSKNKLYKLLHMYIWVCAGCVCGYLVASGIKQNTYGIKQKRVDTYEIMSRFEELAQSLNRHDIAKGDQLKANLNTKSVFFEQLQNMSSEFIKLSKKAMDNLNEEEHEALVKLAKDPNIVISKADKGNAVVIQNVADYKAKVKLVLENPGKFEKLPNERAEASEPVETDERLARVDS